MQIYASLDDPAIRRLAGGSLSIGNFEGVHLGHRRIVELAGRIARPVVAITFNPHPMAVLSPRQAPPVITPLELKARLLGQAGADAVIALPTSRELLALAPEQFVRSIVVERLGPKAIVEGPDFGFGRGRAGDIQTLTELGSRYGFAVHVVHGESLTLPGHHEPTTISSTLIRRLIGGGSVEAAAQCMGRPYRLVGRPVSGHGRGRQIGFPTVNLDTGAQLLPGEGIYAGRAESEQFRGLAAISIGPAPTFDQYQPAVEAHLLDFTGQFTCSQVELDVVARLRPVVRFESVEELVAQIGEDVEEVRRLMGAGK